VLTERRTRWGRQISSTFFGSRLLIASAVTESRRVQWHRASDTQYITPGARRRVLGHSPEFHRQRPGVGILSGTCWTVLNPAGNTRLLGVLTKRFEGRLSER
jgi:hypothetical protein